jgi:hypothetical protein
VGVAWVVWWDEGAFAAAGGEGPAVLGFQVVVELAERVEFVESGVFGLRPGLPMVVFNPGAPTSGHGAGGGAPGEGDFLGGGWVPPEVGDVDHVGRDAGRVIPSV